MRPLRKIWKRPQLEAANGVPPLPYAYPAATAHLAMLQNPSPQVCRIATAAEEGPAHLKRLVKCAGAIDTTLSGLLEIVAPQAA